MCERGQRKRKVGRDKHERENPKSQLGNSSVKKKKPNSHLRGKKGHMHEAVKTIKRTSEIQGLKRLILPLKSER